MTETPSGKQLTKQEFDAAARSGGFAEGPVIDSFGDGPGDPYNPDRKAWGVLASGEAVWAWVRGPKSEEPSQ